MISGLDGLGESQTQRFDGRELRGQLAVEEPGRRTTHPAGAGEVAGK